jgi:hypothetical protein
MQKNKFFLGGLLSRNFPKEKGKKQTPNFTSGSNM